MARWSFYGGMRDIHRCSYGTRPSGTLSSAAQGKIGGPHLGPRNSSKVKSLANPKIVPLIKILTLLFPFPPFFHPTHPIPTRSLEFSLSKFFLAISLYLHPPDLHVPNFAWQSSLIPISRRISIWFSLGSPSYLPSLRPRIISSRSFIYGLNQLWVSIYHISHLGCGLSHSWKHFLFPSIYMQNSRCHCSLPLGNTPMCIWSTLSLTILLLRDT